jgi:hypothetical protein
MVAAELHFSNTILAAREMFGKGYLRLALESAKLWINTFCK